MKIVVVGAGASGLVAAIFAAKNGNEVTVLERNNSCAKKILLTGNGKCNYFNGDQDLRHYHTQDVDVLKQIITEANEKEILSFFDSIGIVPKIKNGYFYPLSNQATSIKEALLLQAKLLHVAIKNMILVDEIVKEDNHFLLNPLKERIEADAVILALGSKACPKTGTDGSGYALARSFGHSLVEVLPALVPLKAQAKYLKDWAGVRCDARITLYENGEKVRAEQGELQLTDYGISGICSFNLSTHVSRGLFESKNLFAEINFMPWLPFSSIEEGVLWLEKRSREVKNRNIEQLLEGFLHYKLIHVILKECHISSLKQVEDLTEHEKRLLLQKLLCFHVDLTGTESFDRAQVCTGGVPLTEINPKTMESLKEDGLYLVGELLDVDGDCGGYNLGFAWVSGMLAGKSIGGNQ